MVAIRSLLKAVLVFVLVIPLSGCRYALLDPKGIIANAEMHILIESMLLMLIVVIPVVVLSIVFSWRYREGKNAAYEPEWSHSTVLEIIWWTIPCIIIGILAMITWNSCHRLDPFKPLASNEKPLVIQVIALDWKWLFIYPKENIATVNYMKIPVNTPIELHMTADNVPMSSFIVAQMGSQIYAMAGMKTQLHLIANQLGEFRGLNTLVSGDGFSEMYFNVDVVDEKSMQQWVKQVQKSPEHLTESEYKNLLNPSIGDAPMFFSQVPANFLDKVVELYMMTFGSAHPRQNQIKFHQMIH